MTFECIFTVKRLGFGHVYTGSTISTLLHDKINPKNCQVLSLGDTGFLQFFRVVSRDDKANPVIRKIAVYCGSF